MSKPIPYTKEALLACLQRLLAARGEKLYYGATYPVAQLWANLARLCGGGLRADFELARDKGLALEDVKWERQ